MAGRSSSVAGRTLGDFVVRDKIGAGGFGAVYRAQQPLLGREAVIKVLHARLSADAVIIDLRSPEAFARGHIVNAKNIPLADLDANEEKITRFKSKPILAVCDAGISSNKAVDKLRKSGIESVYGLKGGIAAWTQANLPLVTGKKTKSKGKK